MHNLLNALKIMNILRNIIVSKKMDIKNQIVKTLLNYI